MSALQPMLYIVRGLPGSGKTTLAEALSSTCFSADDFFTRDGVYTFDPSRLSAAHESCRVRVHKAMSSGVHPIAVHNTFSRLWEISPYVLLAKQHGYRITAVTTEGSYGSVHGVPGHTIVRMAQRWQQYDYEHALWLEKNK
jgi:predicted kinase